MSLRLCSRAPEMTIALDGGIGTSFYTGEQTFVSASAVGAASPRRGAAIAFQAIERSSPAGYPRPRCSGVACAAR